MSRLIHQHTNMIHGGVHAADLARDAGHISLSQRMRELWSQVERLGGYASYNARQALRGRWMILRDRIAASQPTERYGAISELTEIFGSVKVSDNEAKLFDFLLVGRLPKVGLCPSDVFSVIMACW